MTKQDDLLLKNVTVNALSSSGEAVEMAATAQEAIELGKILGVEKVSTARFIGKARRYKKTGFRMTGTLAAEIEQACVVTNEPVGQSLDIEIDRKFLPQENLSREKNYSEDGELIIDPDADEPDELDGGTLNLWDILIEEMNLAVDPFPRKTGVVFSPDEQDEGSLDQQQDDLNKPFANLNTLISEKKSKK